MPVDITNEVYNGVNALAANAGDWVTAKTEFSVRFAVGSSATNKFTYNNQAGNFKLTLQTGDLGATYGFLAGDALTLTYTLIGAPPPIQSQTFTCNILYVSGNSIFIDVPFTIQPAGTQEHIDGRQFPTDNYTSGLLIVADRAPAAAEFQFNLTPNGSSSLNSIIDGSLNRFELQVVTGIPTGVPQVMTQLTDRSGGLIKDVTITLVSTPGGGWRNYRIDYTFWQWGIIKDGYTTDNPPYYNNADHIAPIAKIKCFAQYGNPNGILTSSTENTEGNTGGFDENYNGGINNYSFQAIQWQDSLGNAIDALDYSGTCTFQAVINATNQDAIQSTYRIGLVWRPIDGSVYQNNIYNMGENLLLIAPEVDFLGDGTIDPTVYQGYTNPSGARWDLTDLQFTIVGATVEVNGTVIPNAAAATLFAQFPDSERKSTMWVSIADFNLPLSITDRVSLKIFDEDNIDAPTVGVQIPDVLSEVLFDHGLVDITDATNPNTTTEDDVLYQSEFLLIDNVEYQGIRARFWAYNTVTDEGFTLEDVFFSFDNVVNIAGQFQPNFVINRGFNLPPTTDRNLISLVRKPSLDIAGKYGIQIDYGYLSDWRYWLEQSNVDNDFFDILEQFNGKNKNWQRFFSGDWVLRLSYYTRVDGVDDFNHQTIKIRPYEDDPNITTVTTYTVLSTGATPTNLVENELIEVQNVLTWATGAYTNEWLEATIEDYESGNRWVLSSVLPQGNVVNNPLKPIVGAVGLDVVVSPSNVVTTKHIIDTNLINVNKVSISVRVYSEDTPLFEPLLTVNKDAEVAYSVRKVASNAIYPDTSPCMKVRRSSDNTELDIGFLNNELDQAALLAFVGTTSSDNGFVSVWYDQSGNGFNASRVVLADQPRIVNAGVVDVDPNNGLPALVWDAVNDILNIASISTSQLFYQSFVFNRATSGIISTGMAATAATPYPFLWFTSDTIFDGMGAVNTVHDVGQTQTGDFLQTVLRDSSNNVKMWQNGGALTTVVNVDVGASLQRVGNRNGNVHNGHMQEVVYWKKDKEANRTFIETNTNDYYSIF